MRTYAEASFLDVGSEVQRERGPLLYSSKIYKNKMTKLHNGDNKCMLQ